MLFFRWSAGLKISNPLIKDTSRKSSVLKVVIVIKLTCVGPCIVVIWEEENQLDATQCFIELAICSTCFAYVFAHHQEPATVLLVWHVACKSWLLVVGRSGAGQQAMHSG